MSIKKLEELDVLLKQQFESFLIQKHSIVPSLA